MNFELANPTNLEEALDSKRDGARWFAGGTDLIPELKTNLVAPPRLVNLKRIHGLRGIQLTEEGVRIGALTTLAEIARHETLLGEYTALAQACELAASPQIRGVATIGGNLCQDSRCPYYRNGFNCWLRGGDTCYMREGENREAAVIGFGDCVHVHPSDPAAALAVFDARIVTQARAGGRTIPVLEFFHAPDAADRRMNVLADDEIVTAIDLPRVTPNTRSVYLKAMDRATWTFALASVAVRAEVTRTAEGMSRLDGVRVVFGGIAPVPWRELRIDQTLSGMTWNEESVTQVTADLLSQAQPLAHNRYKIRLARGILKRALQECAG